MKKSILFVAQNMQMNGANKSLLNLLFKIDTSKYDVNLFLYAHIGPLMDCIPQKINLLPEDNSMKAFELSFKEVIVEKNISIKLKIIRIIATIKKWMFNDVHSKEKLTNYSKLKNACYDVAIGFCEGSTHKFIINHISAHKKIGWVHIDYSGVVFNVDGEKNTFDKLDYIVTVSQSSAMVLRNIFNLDSKKVKVIYNIIPIELINHMANEEVDISKKREVYNLLTIGRIAPQKGIDIAMLACKKLLEENFEIKWRVIGEGVDFEKCKKKVEELGLKDNFFLIGKKTNPYNYLKHCDIYVQPSRSEGWGLTVSEAKVLRKPIVVSDIPEFREQIEHLKNGLMVELTPEGVANGIIRLIESENLREKFSKELGKENLCNDYEVEKLYELVQGQ